MAKLKKMHLLHPKVTLTNNRLIAGLMSLTTLVVAISIVLSKTWLGDIGFNNKVISRKNAAKNTLEENVAAIPKLQENFKFLEDNGPPVFDIFRALPNSPDYAGLTAELEAAATLVGVQLQSLSPQVAVAGEQPMASGVATSQEVVFQLSANGTYVSLQQLLTNLENSKRPIRLNTLTFSGSEPSLTLSVTLTTYWQPLTQIGDQTEEINEN